MGVIDAARIAQPLIAVRFFSSLTNYAIGDVVVQGGAIYMANQAVTAGAFQASQWVKNATMGDASGLMPIAGGIFTGPVTLFGPPTTPLMAATKAYVDALSAALGATYVDVAGDTMTGNLTIAPAAGAVLVLNKGQATNIAGIFGQTAGVNRWQVQLGTGGGEAANGGSDFAIYAYNDAGTITPGGPSLTIPRLTPGYLMLNAPGATALVPPSVASSGNSGIQFNKAANKTNFINASTNGVIRWQVLPGNSTAEGGANTGSDFTINAFGDSGSGLGTALTITRANLTAQFGGHVYIGGLVQAVNTMQAIAGSGSQNPIVQCVKNDGVAVARMYTLGTGNVAYWDNPTTGVSMNMGSQFGFNGNATFANSVGVNGTLGIAGATNMAALTSAGHQVNGALGVTGGISMNGGINYNWVAANTIRFGWDSGNTYILAGVDASNQGNLVTSYQPTQVRGIALNGGNQNMYAYYAGSNVHWPFVWNLVLLEEQESGFDALAAINSLNVKHVRFQQTTDDENEPERAWPVALTRSDIMAKMAFAAVPDPKIYPNARKTLQFPRAKPLIDPMVLDEDGEPMQPIADEFDEVAIPDMDTSPLEFKTEPMIAALVRAVQQLTARVAELEGAPQRRAA
jgi:hypothetical protein